MEEGKQGGGLLATMRAGIGFLKSNHQNARERAPETVGEGRSDTNRRRARSVDSRFRAYSVVLLH